MALLLLAGPWKAMRSTPALETPMTSPRPRPAAVLRLLVLASVLSGCATLGIRPNEPTIQINASACAEYERYSTYAQELQEAYHSRASQNRGWLYAAGILGLGVMAASGGLAAASTVGAGTLALLAISGGFAGGAFAAINNEALALSYTVAANSVDESLKNARGQLAFVDPNDPNKGYKGASCAAALPILMAGVSAARTHLEVARTDNAAGAMARAKDQLTLLNKQVAAVQPTDLLHVTLDAEIVNVAPLAPAGPSTDTPVTITVRNIPLDEVKLTEVKVVFGTKQLAVTAIEKDPVSPATYAVKFAAPAAKPDAIKEYRPALILQGKTVVPAKEDKVFKYP